MRGDDWPHPEDCSHCGIPLFPEEEGLCGACKFGQVAIPFLIGVCITIATFIVATLALGAWLL